MKILRLQSLGEVHGMQKYFHFILLIPFGQQIVFSLFNIEINLYLHQSYSNFDNHITMITRL